jgi:hypothetical protein
VVFFLVIKNSQGQSHKCGLVLDSKTILPVPYATVSGNGFGTYADSMGFFQINENVKDTFLISSIGYSSKKVVLSEGFSCDTFFLESMALNLPKIEIGKYPWLSNNFIEQISLKDTKQTKFTCNVIEGVTIIKYFPNPDTNKIFIIGDLKIKISQKSDLYQPRKIRFKIFEATASKLPGKDLLQSKEVFTIEKPKSDYILFDLNRFAVSVPKSGYFIGIEFLTPKIDDDNAGIFVLSGKLSREFENGEFYIRYYTNTFRLFTLSETQKVNLFFNTRIYEHK